MTTVYERFMMKLGRKYLPINPKDDADRLSYLKERIQLSTKLEVPLTVKDLKEAVTVIENRSSFTSLFGDTFDFKPVSSWTIEDYSRLYDQYKWQFDLEVRELELCWLNNYIDGDWSYKMCLEHLQEEYTLKWSSDLQYNSSLGCYVPLQCYNWDF